MANLAAPTIDPTTVARVILHGDLSKLTDDQKVSYYRAVCESVGLNPLTQPFQYLVLSGREILYVTRAGTEQLRLLHHVTIAILARELVDGIYVVTARATLPTGRGDENIGAVPVDNVKGEARANAMMKAETKAKRRATLAICGLGMLDESEVDALPADVVEQAPQLPAVTPGPALAVPDAIPPGYVLVKRVRQEPTKKPGVIRFHILLSSGHEVTTINQWQASVAEGHLNAKTPVQVETKETPWGTDLVGFEMTDGVRDQVGFELARQLQGALPADLESEVLVYACCWMLGALVLQAEAAGRDADDLLALVQRSVESCVIRLRIVRDAVDGLPVH